ncbi:MAG: NYN domain-containing protein [Candidatus Nanopelagicales bacterium]
MADSEKRIAVLIDADNAPASKIDVILNEVATFGVANVRRAYGNWKSPSLKPWEDNLHTHAIQPVQQFAYSTGKNASDIAMVIDALDLLHAGVMDGCAIVSSDADFTPLVMRLRASGCSVHGFGERKTPQPFVDACSTFTYVDALPTADGEPASSTKRVPPAALRSDTRLVQMLRAAVAASVDEEGGWAHLSQVRNQIGNQASFDPRNYGYAKFSDLIEATGLFEIRRQNLTILVRMPVKKPATAPAKKTSAKQAAAKQAAGKKAAPKV